MGRSQVVRHRVLISCTVGSNPTAPAIQFVSHEKLLFQNFHTLQIFNTLVNDAIWNMFEFS